MARLIALLGSDCTEQWAEPIDRMVLGGADRGDGSVVVVPTASAPDGDGAFASAGRRARAHYRYYGVFTKVLPLRTREDAFMRANVEAFDQASVIVVTGGKPAYLCNALRETPVWRAMASAVEQGGALVAWGAGASMLGDLAPSAIGVAPEIATWVAGLEMFGGTLLMPEWDALDDKHEGVRAHVCEQVADGRQVVGIGGRTALVGDGATWQVLGEGRVCVCQGRDEQPYFPGEAIELPLTGPGRQLLSA